MHLRLQIDLKFTGKWVWIVICLAILQIGMGVYMADPSSTYSQLPFYPFLGLMLWLSFPAGLIPVYLLEPINPATDYFLLWLLMFAAGYIQWFVLLPRLNKLRLTTLDLNKPRKRTMLGLDSAEASSSETPESGATLRFKAAAQRPARAAFSRSAFDRRGLTPLERAIRRNSARQ